MPGGKSPITPSRDDRWKTCAVCGFLVLAIATVFGQTVRYGFVNFDDRWYVYGNRHVLPGLTPAGIAWALTSTHGQHWHPLTSMSHMLDCDLYGRWAGGHHLTNLLLHAAASIALFLVLREMTGRFWPSALVAALFAVHPLRAESVAWVSERKDVLSALLCMATVAAYVGYARRPFSLLRYLGVAGLFVLGLMAKPMLVTLPLVLLLLDFWPLGRMNPAAPEDSPTAAGQLSRFGWRLARLLAEKIPLLILSAGFSVLAVFTQGGFVQTLEQCPMSWRLANVVVAYVTYLRQFFYPVGLAAYYPFPKGTLPLWEVVGACLLLTAITIAAIVSWRKAPYLLVGWLWYLGMLVPVIGFVHLGAQAMADRYTYLPQIGLCIALTWGLAAAIPWSRASCRWACGAASALVLGGLMIGAWRQTSYWSDSETLWTRTLACTSQNWLAHSNFGDALKDRGAIDEAMEQYRQAIDINPTLAEPHNQLGAALFAQGRLAEAIVQYQEALDLKPDLAEAHANLGLALRDIAQPDAAIAQYEEAIENDPESVEAHNDLGLAWLDCGRPDDAIAEFEEAVKIDPDCAVTHYNLGLALRQQNKFSDAVAAWHKAVRLKPDHVESLQWLAWLLATCPDSSIRNGPEAVQLARRAADLSDDRDPAILDVLGAGLAETGQFAAALKTARQALALATAQKKDGVAAAIKARIGLYETGKPFHEK